MTSPSRDESSRIGKGVWVKRNMPGVPVKFGFKADGKARFAGPNKILIDDGKLFDDAETTALT